MDKERITKEMNISIASPPWTGSGKKIERKIRKALYEYSMVDEISHLTVALSGGKDSLTLLFMLKAISGRGFPPFKLSAAHVTGDFSCGAGVNTSYLKAICDELNIPLTIKESHQELETLECYSCSRERRKLLFESAKDFGSETVAFGHHRDDNIQTLLMNLLHKAEFAGNMPKIHMKKYETTIIRPMIFVTEQEIVAFAQQHQFMRVMCQCPVGQTSMRKKAEDLIREIEDTFPDARHNLSKAALRYGSDKALTP
jgi:tRNA 2-thiocytidine biosynthesis protein TtcA